MITLRHALFGAALVLAPVTAQGQSNYPSVGGATVPASAVMCINGSGQAVPASVTCPIYITGTITVDTSLLATAANQATELTRLGDVTETAPTTDTASSGLNGRLQRIAQRLTSLITALGSPFQAGGSIGNTTFGATLSATPTVAAGNGVVAAPSSETLAGITPVVSASLESNHVIKGSAGNFYGGYITTGATAGWLLIANSTTAPTAGGAAIAPLACVLAPANQTTSIGGPWTPMVFSTGVTMVFSTSGCLTNTASTTAFFSGMAK